MRRAATLLSFALCLIAQSALGQAWPAKPIRLILAFPPGGTVDALARPLAERLSAALGQSVVIENKPGGQTIIAGEVVAKAAPDGYTLYVMSGSHVLAPYLVKEVPYDAINDFTPITIFGTQGYVFAAGAKEPFSTMTEMISYGKPNPRGISIGVSDSTTQAVVEALRLQAGIDVTVINYKGGGPIFTDLLGGQLPVGIVSPPVFTPYVKDARLRGLAVSVPNRMPFLPDVPAAAEALGNNGFDVQTWYGFAGPAKLPKPVVDRLHAEIMKILAEPDMRKVIAGLGLVPPADPSPEASAAMLRAYAPKMGKLLQSAGVKPE